MDADRVAFLGTSASLLELSGWPKPGNVHRTADFPGTRFEHFEIGAASLYPSLKRAAAGEKAFGLLLMDHVKLSYSLQKGGNTHLGTAMLLIPLAYAAGGEELASCPEARRLAREASQALKETTWEDSLNYYQAIRTSMPASMLGKLKEDTVPDIMDPEAGAKLRDAGSSVYDIMEASSDYDMVADEQAHGFVRSLEVCNSYSSYLASGASPNSACVKVFLEVLASYGDTFMARKAGTGVQIRQKVKDGLSRTSWVRAEASKILSLGGPDTKEGLKMLFSLDRKLRRRGLSPGSVADVTAAGIFLALLSGAIIR